MHRKDITKENETKTPEELKPKRRVGRPRKVKEEPKVEPTEETTEEPMKLVSLYEVSPSSTIRSTVDAV